MHQDKASQNSSQPDAGRRDFLKKATSVVLGGLAIGAPMVSGAMVILDPLRHKSQGNAYVPVTSLRSIPEDGLPRKFVITASHSDAWNRSAGVRVGAVYLRRTGPATIQAFNVVCPHAGCFVDFDPRRQGYACPCHNSTFTLDGKIADPKSPSPRGLDPLEVEIRDDQVWVRFQNYLAGHEQRIPA